MGAIAGFTIFIGLPMGRVRSRAPRLKAWLNALAIGILIFLVWDVLAHAWDPIDVAVEDRRIGVALATGLALAGGIGVGLLGLVYFDRWVARRTSAGTRRRAAADGEVPVAVAGPANAARD